MKKLGLLIAFLSITLIIGCGDTASSEESPIGDEQGLRLGDSISEDPGTEPAT